MHARQHIWAHGLESLPDADVLALLLGPRDAEELARTLLADVGGLQGLSHASPRRLSRIRGVGPSTGLRLVAAIELARRTLSHHPERPTVHTAEEAASLFQPRLAARPDEELHALFLDRRRRCIAVRMLTRGCHAYTIVDARQIYRVALSLGASAVVLGHNHPSGDPSPSAPDIDVTARVERAGRLLGVPLLDHIIIGGGHWSSMASLGHLGSNTTWSP